MQVYIIPSVVNSDIIMIDYTNGAHQFLLQHKVQYRTKYDSLIVDQPMDGITVEAETIQDLIDLAEKYDATISITSYGCFEIEFIG